MQCWLGFSTFRLFYLSFDSWFIGKHDNVNLTNVFSNYWIYLQKEIQHRDVNIFHRICVNHAWLNPHLSNIKANLHRNNKQSCQTGNLSLWQEKNFSLKLFLFLAKREPQYWIPLSDKTKKVFELLTLYSLLKGRKRTSLLKQLSPHLFELVFLSDYYSQLLWIIHSTSLLFII